MIETKASAINTHNVDPLLTVLRGSLGEHLPEYGKVEISLYAGRIVSVRVERTFKTYELMVNLSQMGIDTDEE